jgi:hypothetical protein
VSDTLILPSDIDGLTETDTANFLITSVVAAGGRLYTALTVAGLFLGDEMIRARFHPADAAEEQRQRAERTRWQEERRQRQRDGARKAAATKAARKEAGSGI